MASPASSTGASTATSSVRASVAASAVPPPLPETPPVPPVPGPPPVAEVPPVAGRVSGAASVSLDFDPHAMLAINAAPASHARTRREVEPMTGF
jgi:hypothetical protein